MKNAILGCLSLLYLTSCSYTSSEMISENRFKLTYDPPLEDYLTASSRPSTYSNGQLTAEAIDKCPNGYTVIDNKHIITSPDSRIEWTIECLR